MNLLDIANLRDQLKEDVLVVERFMDIVRREGKVKDPPPMEPAPSFQDGVISMARSCISAINLIEDSKWTPTDARLWLRAVISNDEAYLQKNKIREQIVAAMSLTDREAQPLPPTIEEQLRAFDAIPRPTEEQGRPVFMACDHCKQRVPSYQLKHIADVNLDICPECFEKAKIPCKSC